jgi:hypothetical protein
LTSYSPDANTPPPEPVLSNFDEGQISLTFLSGQGLPSAYSASTALRVSGLPASGGGLTELAGADGFSRLRLLYNVAGNGPRDPALTFRYASYAIWHDEAGVDVNESAHIFGFPTPATMLPTTGVRTLSGIVRGTRIRAFNGGQAGRTDLTGTATVTLDFAAGKVTVQMDIDNLAGSFANSFFFNGIPTFQGGLGGVSGLPSGSVKGALFGPAGEEVALVFTLSDSGQSLPEEENRIVGVLIAK